ncbi:TolC family protein [Pyramidobacter piscolens]|uniref:TolC family protein n=1 Tax=Pyramidobacter piscolens TaxID=638849 RepID=UPI003AB209B6
MKRIVRALLLSGVFLCPAGLRAQDLSIGEAIATALEQSPTLNARRQELNKAKGDIVQARGNFLPRLSLTGQYSDNRYPTVSGGSRTDSVSGGIALTQNLYAGGRHAAQRRQAQTTLSQAELGVREAEEALAVNVYDAFYGVILAREKVAAARDAVETSRKHLQEVRQMLGVGLANQLEVIRAEQQLSANEAALASSRGAFDAERITLLNLMGLAPSSALLPKGPLELADPRGTARQSVALAQKRRADVAMLEKQIAIQSEQIKIVRGAMKPSFDLSATADYSDPYRNQDAGDDSWKATLTLEIPLYDRGQTRGEVMKAKAVQEQNKQALRQKELDVLSEIELAWIEIGDSAVQVEAHRKSLALARETLRLSQVGYREGVTPQLDLLEAQSNLTAARKDYSQSLFDHLMKVVALKRAEGALIPWTLEGKKR